MQLETVAYQNFRNIEQQTLQFSPGLNILVGDNAQGKTNALEGIFLFASLRSFRGVREREMIRLGAAHGSLCMQVTEGGDTETLSIDLFENAPKKMKRNGIVQKRSADMLGRVRCVLFCPEHLSLIQGSSAGRRNFLDTAIAQLRPAYDGSLCEYSALLRQRNALLRGDEMGEAEKKDLALVLSAQMSAPHARITAARRSYLAAAREIVRDFMCEMSHGGETVTLLYQSGGEAEQTEESPGEIQKRYLAECEQNIGRDLRAGMTLSGCHRDDFSVLVNGLEAKAFCSQGQDRSLVLALKLAEGELSKRADGKNGEYPIFLLDDVTSELDRRRRETLFSFLAQRQVLLTACEEMEGTAMPAEVHRVKGGLFFEEKNAHR